MPQPRRAPALPGPAWGAPASPHWLGSALAHRPPRAAAPSSHSLPSCPGHLLSTQELLCSWGSVRALFSLHAGAHLTCVRLHPQAGQPCTGPCASIRGCLKGLPHLPPGPSEQPHGLPAPSPAGQLPGLLTRPPPEAPRLRAAASGLEPPCAAPRNPDPSEVTARHPFPLTSGSHQGCFLSQDPPVLGI